MTTEKTPGGILLRHQLAISPESSKIRGRIVLANTRLEGSDVWGVNADQAEAACERIARYQSQSGGSRNSLIRSFLRQFLSFERKETSQKMVGHLLSVGSSHEVLALTRLLSPLPKGSYWTGGRLVRYRVNNMHQNIHTDHVILTWTDGRIGKPDILGMTSEDRKQLHEGYNYCLALDFRESTWQARDCSDQLPYACLITPRQFTFSNKVTVHSTAGSGGSTPPSVETTITTPSSTGPMRSTPSSTVTGGFARASNELGAGSTPKDQVTTSTEEMKTENEEATTITEQSPSAEESTTTEESTTAEETTTTEESTTTEGSTTAEESTTAEASTTAEESTTAALLKGAVPQTTELPVMTTLSVMEEQSTAVIPEESGVSRSSFPVPILSQKDMNAKSEPSEVENSLEEVTKEPGSAREAAGTHTDEDQSE
ncbi:hypothetical protein CLF_109569 [Clonorchis sinensis]|uniref:C-type lectin domain-containing protein n=1 Tax=Clonorchis sinensis TaxID=79923 RepID=H2KSK2_CLOSI|nr:hypothetical protein CLF_109569 [Clonorchis sinensis]